LKYDVQKDRWEWVFYQNPKMLDALPDLDYVSLQGSGRVIEDLDNIYPIN
jgi:hypothetical protein